MARFARIAKHPVHPMLVSFPIALFIVALICDVVRAVAGVSSPYWTLAYYSIGAGVAGALLAAVPGFIDYLSLEPDQVRRLGLKHMLMNSVVVVLFVINFYLRRPSGAAAAGENQAVLLVLSLLGVALLGLSGWLGAEMVYVHGVGVQKRAESKRE
jgi:uncharacterized membrane protein